MGMTKPAALRLLPYSLSCTFSAQFVSRVPTRGDASFALRTNETLPRASMSKPFRLGLRTRFNGVMSAAPLQLWQANPNHLNKTHNHDAGPSADASCSRTLPRA